PQRGRQDHPVQRGHRPVCGRRGIDPVRRAQPGRAPAQPDLLPRHRPDLPDGPPVPQHDRAREHHGRPALPDQVGGVRGGPAAARHQGRGTAGGGAGALGAVVLWGTAGRGAGGKTRGGAGGGRPPRSMPTNATRILRDEPTAGMNPRETQEMTSLIGKLRDERGFTIVVIEHDMRLVKGVSDRVVALDYGRKIADGTYDEVANDERVIEAY